MALAQNTTIISRHVHSLILNGQVFLPVEIEEWLPKAVLSLTELKSLTWHISYKAPEQIMAVIRTLGSLRDLTLSYIAASPDDIVIPTLPSSLVNVKLIIVATSEIPLSSGPIWRQMSSAPWASIHTLHISVHNNSFIDLRNIPEGICDLHLTELGILGHLIVDDTSSLPAAPPEAAGSPVALAHLPQFRRLRTLDISIDVDQVEVLTPLLLQAISQIQSLDRVLASARTRYGRSGITGTVLRDSILDFSPIHPRMFNPSLEIHFGYRETYHLYVGYPGKGVPELQFRESGEWRSCGPSIEEIEDQSTGKVAERRKLSHIVTWARVLAKNLIPSRYR
ncbi:hypothetical protein C8J56DRAFT_1064303 [Mycena floridula]|nr:hypothetical protein C8J56DRAFT_1064303 [Mycena floridula]